MLHSGMKKMRRITGNNDVATTSLLKCSRSLQQSLSEMYAAATVLGKVLLGCFIDSHIPYTNTRTVAVDGELLCQLQVQLGSRGWPHTTQDTEGRCFFWV